MHPSLRVLGARAHQPLIKFAGRRTWPSTPTTPHAHPAAPPEFQKVFTGAARPSSTITKGNSSHVFTEFWQAPEHVWNPRVHSLEENEIEAILSGGASLR